MKVRVWERDGAHAVSVKAEGQRWQPTTRISLDDLTAGWRYADVSLSVPLPAPRQDTQALRAQWNAGYTAGRSAGYQEGRTASRNAGYQDGYAAGQSAGYATGYAAGQSSVVCSAPSGRDGTLCAICQERERERLRNGGSRSLGWGPCYSVCGF